MINRVMVRTRVIQTLFAYFQAEGRTQLSARQELLKSFSGTYSLYMMFLEFVNALTDHAEQVLADECARARAMHESLVPNRRFVDNTFAKQVFQNLALRKYVEEQHLSWEAGFAAVNEAYKLLVESDFYKEYMAAETATYEDDKRVWRKIFTDILPEMKQLESALEEMEVVLDNSCWSIDADVVVSYVIKTIKRFNEEAGADQALLEMFDNEDELAFGQNLLRYAIDKHEANMELVTKHLKNWQMERVAFMDKVILNAALTEIMCFPEIPLQVTMNEYLDIAKEYSGEKSYIFINGILDEIVKQLRQENKIFK